MVHWRFVIFNTEIILQFRAFSACDINVHILKTKLPELFFPGKYKKCFKIILKLEDEHEQLLNVLQGSQDSFQLPCTVHFRCSTAFLSFISIKYKPNTKCYFLPHVIASAYLAVFLSTTPPHPFSFTDILLL